MLSGRGFEEKKGILEYLLAMGRRVGKDKKEIDGSYSRLSEFVDFEFVVMLNSTVLCFF